MEKPVLHETKNLITDLPENVVALRHEESELCIVMNNEGELAVARYEKDTIWNEDLQKEIIWESWMDVSTYPTDLSRIHHWIPIPKDIVEQLLLWKKELKDTCT